MWKTFLAIREGKVAKIYESAHTNMPIEKIIQLTWQPKEIVPAIAAPRLRGQLSFWRASLKNLQGLLNLFGNELKESELRLQAHPHPISGALDFQQRFEFLRFHINRHQEQVLQILKAMQD